MFTFSSSFFSKSSHSGSSGFACYKAEGSAKPGTALPPASSSMSTVKKKEPKHKKSKIKTIERTVAPATPEVVDQARPQAHISPDDKAAKVAALSQALDCIDKFRKNQESKEFKTGGPDEAEINDLATNLQEASQGASTKSNKSLPFVGTVEAKDQISEVLDKEQISRAGEGFCAAVSLNDGMVMQTTETITAVLGYPKDMWHGRSFIDFVHPKDRCVFTNKITSVVVLPFGDQMKGQKGSSLDPSKNKENLGNSGSNIFCRLRMYNGLKAGKFSVKDRKTVYQAFKLGVYFKVEIQKSK